MDLRLVANDFAFYSAAGLALLGALGVAFSRQVLHACLCLLPCLFGVAVCFGLLEAHLLFAVQILVYVGAITVLILFAVMLLQRSLGRGILAGQQHLFGAVVATGIIFVTIAAALILSHGPWTPLAQPITEAGITSHNVQLIGALLLTTYLLPFEAASVVLLVAMIGAIVIARRDSDATRDAAAAPEEVSAP